MEYQTIICDIKNSRQLKNRQSVQYQIIDMLKQANNLFSPDLAAPFIITIGDEWQGLLKYPCDYQQILDFFQKTMGQIQFYCGIGIGPITINDFELTVNQLDGPSFYHARKAIQLAKEGNHSLIIIK
ncbi:MAG: SatD family protein [Dehalobacterium sp.]